MPKIFYILIIASIDKMTKCPSEDRSFLSTRISALTSSVTRPSTLTAPTSSSLARRNQSVCQPPKTSLINRSRSNQPNLHIPNRNPTLSTQPKLQPNTIKKDSIPTARKGLAKFTNPIECQRQFEALNQNIKSLKDEVVSKNKSILILNKQVQAAQAVGFGYAVCLQYFAEVLKLENSKFNLVEERNSLRSEVKHLQAIQSKHSDAIELLKEDYESRLELQSDQFLLSENSLKAEISDYQHKVNELLKEHANQKTDLINEHAKIKEELESTIESLTEQLEARTKELELMRREHDSLSNRYQKLEETLTKDSDAKVKYAHEKIVQLQKDVESLNSVLELRNEKFHELERDSLKLTEVQGELKAHKDTIKSLKQQLESMTAALDKKREQYENLILEHEKVRQELKKEHLERRRLTMKSEQLEYAFNESSEENMFNSSGNTTAKMMLSPTKPSTSTPVKFDNKT